MSQDDRTPTLPLRHIARFGYPFPPMGGGDPTGDPQNPEGSEGTPAPSTAPDPPALPFSLDDVPESLSGAEARSWLLARQGQMQAGYTKAVNESREAQKRAERALSLTERLENEDTRREAIKELLDPYGIDLEWDDDDELDGDVPTIDVDELDEDDDDELAERIEAIEQRFQQDDQKTAEQAWINHTRAGLQAFAEREKVAGGIDALPEVIRQQIVANAMTQPRLDGGLLDMEAGIRMYDAQVAEVQRVTRQGYVASKDTPKIELGGGHADPHIDLTTSEGRMKRAMEIAQRHL